MDWVYWAAPAAATPAESPTLADIFHRPSLLTEQLRRDDGGNTRRERKIVEWSECSGENSHVSMLRSHLDRFVDMNNL